MGFSTEGDDDSKKNDCGITANHAFSLVTIFNLNHGGKTHNMVMIRNPRH